MNLNQLTLLDAIKGLKEKKFTSVQLTEACFAQIEAHDSKIHAFLVVPKKEALKQAQWADSQLKEHDPVELFNKFPLLGIPYACKDNFNTEGIETTASSNVLKGYIPPYESTVSSRLKAAGAVMLGKTNMDAFAHGSSTETSDFGPTFNPWDYSRVAGGSSGGSSAAVSAHMCIFAIGSETSGSIRGPSAWCSVTGLKPTYGRVSRYGVIAMASSTDSPGPIAKTVEDCAYVLNVIAGHDPNDSTSSNKETSDYFLNLQTKPLTGLKLGKPKSYFNIEMQKGVRTAIDAAVEEFKNLGAEIIDMDLLDPKYSIAVYTILQRSEVSSNLARYDGIRYGNDRTNFGFEAKKRMMLGAYSLSAGYYDQYYAKGQKVRTLIVNDFKQAFKDVDLIIGPMMPIVALKLGEGMKNPMFGEMMDVLASPSSIAGLPAISLPAGFSENMPVGLQLIGPMFSEEKILMAGYNYQQVTSFHKRSPDNL